MLKNRKLIKSINPEIKPQKGFIYLVNAKNTNKFKIGKTINIKKRISSLQTSSPVKILYTHSVFVNDITTIELHLHNYFANYRVIGEWFELTDEMVKETILMMNLVAENIVIKNTLKLINKFEKRTDTKLLKIEKIEIEDSVILALISDGKTDSQIVKALWGIAPSRSEDYKNAIKQVESLRL